MTLETPRSNDAYSSFNHLIRVNVLCGLDVVLPLLFGIRDKCNYCEKIVNIFFCCINQLYIRLDKCHYFLVCYGHY